MATKIKQIVDAFGDPVQYIHYAPYGELIAN